MMEEWRRGARLRTADGELAWYERGEGPVIVFLHGGPGHDHRFLRSLAHPLAEQYCCILLDQRGTGGSTLVSADAATLHIDHFVEDIETLRQRLGEERLRLVGWSWGATLGLLYSAAYPDRVARLAMVAPGPISLEAVEVYRANQVRGLTAVERVARLTLLAMMEAAFERGDRGAFGAAHAELAALTLRLSFHHPDRAVAFLREYLDQYGDPFAAAVVERQVLASMGEFAHWDRVGSSAAPVLLIYGYQDFEPITQAFELRDQIPGLRLAFLNECGHWPWLEQPERLYAELTPFLGGTPDSAAVVIKERHPII